MAQTLLCIIAFLSMVCLSQSTPTIQAEKNFDPKKDVDALKKAFDVDGVDKTVVQDILASRSCVQRMDISKIYAQTFKQFIVIPISDRVDGIYGQLLKDSFICADMLSAVHLKRAITKEWKKNVIEIIVTSTQSAETHCKLKESYQKIFDHPYEDYIKEKLDGDFENVLLEMSARVRQPKQPTDPGKAHDTAVKLNEGIDDWDDDREFMDCTLMETPFEQLDLIFREFKNINGRELEEVIGDKFDGDKRDVYQHLIHFCKSYSNNFVEYFACQLRDSFGEKHRDDQTLMRIILLHCETDLKEIKEQFHKSCNEHLTDKIGKDCSEPFEKLLKKFVDGNVKT